MKSIGWVIGGTSGIGLEAATRLEGLVEQVVVVGRSAAHLASARQRLGDTVAIEKVDRTCSSMGAPSLIARSSMYMQAVCA